MERREQREDVVVVVVVSFFLLNKSSSNSVYSVYGRHRGGRERKESENRREMRIFEREKGKTHHIKLLLLTYQPSAVRVAERVCM